MMRGRELGPSGLEAHLNHAPLPVPSPELAKLLDAFDNAIMDYNYGEGRGDIAAARSAIELSFATLTTENERLRLDKTGLEQWKELAQKDLRGLRATALTPEEASFLLDQGFDHMSSFAQSLGAKLRLISGRALSGETPK